MAKCKYCESEDLYLEAKTPEEDVLEADMVALKCKSCGKWLKWVRKTDRHKYIKEEQKQPIVTLDELVEMFEDDTDDNKQFAIKVLKELRKELLNEQVYYRSDVIGAIDRKIKKLNGER